MDIKTLESFFNYELFLDKDPQIILDNIIKKAKKYLPSNNIPGIQKAYEYAKTAHAGQIRLSKEEYIIHPLRATEFLMEINPDLETIQTCILHDVIEDCNVTKEDIQKEFGNEVAKLCESMVKVSKVKYKGEDRHLETLKKTFLAMADDLRVIFVKLADRIHNIQTLYFHPNPIKRQKIAQETMKIYAAIAKRLGLYHYQQYLENGSFKVLNEEAFNKIFSYLKKYFGEGEKYSQRGIKTITNILNKEGIKNFEVKGRTKSPYRVYEKLEKKYQGKDIGEIMDLLAFRVIAPDVGSCYIALGIIHKHYTPVIKRIKDYIAVPKINGYQSIHTTILGMFPFPIEIQIRTHSMDDIAELGVAAHFAYSENNQPIIVPENQTQWIKKLQELVNIYQSESEEEKEKFKKELSIQVLDKRIFIYTPKGDVIELPNGSTVLDFAFAIHTEIGLRFKNGIINGDIKPISYKLKTGDVVNINTFKNKYSANKDWMDFLHTSDAKTHLLRFIKNLQKSDLLKHAFNELDKTLKEYSLPIYGSANDEISKKINKLDMEKRMLEVSDKKTNYNMIIKEIYPKQRDKIIQNTQKTYTKKESPTNISKDNTVIIDEDKITSCSLCHECNPTYGEKIIAKTGKEGIKIHNLDCKSFKTIAIEKLLEAHRSGQEKNNYNIAIEIKIGNKYGNLLNIMTTCSELGIIILQVSIKNNGDGSSTITLESELNNPSKIAFMINSLKKNDDSIQIIKKKIS